MPLASKDINKDHFFSSDTAFNELYPTSIKVLAHRHWTPLEVAKKAAEYLATESKTKILDIGSGVGKFCLAAAYFKPNAFFYGIEQRDSLTEYADTVKNSLGLNNVSFNTGNFTEIDFKQYNHFYFYNAFYENLNGTQKIDNEIEYSKELYDYYHFYLMKQLEKKPKGTKLVTYHSLEEKIPNGYHIVGSDFEDVLQYWIKI